MTRGRGVCKAALEGRDPSSIPGDQHRWQEDAPVFRFRIRIEALKRFVSSWIPVTC